MDGNIQYYPISNSQLAVHQSATYSKHRGMLQLPFIYRSKGRLDYEVMKKAIYEEIRRNDSLRVVFTVRDKICYQYFKDEVIPEIIPYDTEKKPYNFSGKSEQEEQETLSAEAERPLPLLDGTFGRFVFFVDFKGRDCVMFVFNHYNADAYGAIITVLDIFKVYNALISGGDMPKPLGSWKDILASELAYTEEGKKADFAALDEFYSLKKPWKYSSVFDASRSDDRKLIKQSVKKSNITLTNIMSMFQDEGKSEKFNLPAEKADAIDRFCRENGVSFQNFYSMMMRTYTSKINNGREGEVILFFSNRRATYAKKNCGGCMVGLSPLYTVIPATATIGEAFENIAERQNKLYRHLDVPPVELATHMGKTFNVSFFERAGNIAFSLFRIPPELFEILNGDFEWQKGRYMPNSCYIFMIPQSDGSYDMYFNYRSKYLDHHQVQLAFEGFEKVIDAITTLGVGATVGKLLDSIKL